MSHLMPDQIWRYATAALSWRQRRRVREHALQCEACRLELSRATIARHALRPATDAILPTSRELEVWQEEILAESTKSRAASWRFWVGMTAAASAAILVALLVTPSLDSRLAARGSPGAVSLALRALCVVAPDSGEAEIVDPSRAPCPRGSYLKLMVGNLGSSRQRFAAVAYNAERSRWLAPSEAHEPLPALPAEPVPLPGSYRLAADWIGPMTVVVLAVDTERLAVSDPLWVWAKHATPGSYRDLEGRADAVVVRFDVGER